MSVYFTCPIYYNSQPNYLALATPDWSTSVAVGEYSSALLLLPTGFARAGVLHAIVCAPHMSAD